MKKIILISALLLGGATVSTTVYAKPIPQVCDPNSPCIYTGRATNKNGGSCTITVQYDKKGNAVANVTNKGTYYVMKSETDEDKKHGTHYINLNGSKYYFNL